MMSSEKHIEAVGETDPELTESEVELLLAMDRTAASELAGSDLNGADSYGSSRGAQNGPHGELFRAHQITQKFLKAERETLNSNNVGDDLWSKVALRIEQPRIEQPREEQKAKADAKVIPLEANRPKPKWAWLLVAAAALVAGALGWRALTSPASGEVARQNSEHQLGDVDGLDVELLGPANHQELYQAETGSGLATIIWVGEPTVEKPEAGS